MTDQFRKDSGHRRHADPGKLFKSRSITKSKNELLIVVTPRIVHPSDCCAGDAGDPEAVPGQPTSAAAIALTEIRSAAPGEGHRASEIQGSKGFGPMLTAAIASGDTTSSAQLLARLQQTGLVSPIKQWTIPADQLPDVGGSTSGYRLSGLGARSGALLRLRRAPAAAAPVAETDRCFRDLCHPVISSCWTPCAAACRISCPSPSAPTH